MLGHYFDGSYWPGLTPAYGLRRAKVGFGTDGGFSIYVCGLGGVRALFMFMYFIRNRNQLIDHLGLG